jgi:alpha-aminoadipic semialdehyde synthase
VSRGAQEVFRLLPHQYVDPEQLPRLATSDRGTKAQYQVYATVAEAQHMVAPNDPSAAFQKVCKSGEKTGMSMLHV